MLLRFVWTSRRGRAFVVRPVRGTQRNQEERQLVKSAKSSSNKQEATRGGTRARGTGAKRTKSRTAANKAAAKSASPKEPSKKPTASENSKTNAIVKLLWRQRGASIAEIQKATGWQPHSVRGFLSGTVKKRLGHKLLSERRLGGERRYMIGER